MSYDQERYDVRQLEARLEALETTEFVLVLCRKNLYHVSGRRPWSVSSVDDGIYVDSSTWPAHDGSDAPVWFGAAKVWCEAQLWHASSSTPSGKRVGVGNQASREDALRELEWAINRAERPE